MKLFDSTKSVIPSEDLLDAADFIDAFSNELQRYPNRITGSENETACARAIRNRLHDETDAKTRLEAYRAYPLLGRGAFPFLGIWYLLSFVLYFVSFAGNQVAGILLTLLALVVFITGSVALISLFLGRRKLQGILSQKVSYNVVSEFSPDDDKKKNDGEKERVIVIADNHDAVIGSYFKDFGLFRKITIMIAPISAILFVVFCILKMVIGTHGDNAAAKITVFCVIPAIFGVFGIVSMITHFSPFEQHARQNNGIATCVAMATYAYFVEKPELVPSGVKIVYVSFGGENSAHGGSEAFVKSHPEFADANVLCIGDIQSGDIKIAECDAIRKIQFSTPMVSTVRSSAYEQDIEVSTVAHDKIGHKFNSLHGYLSNAFAKNGTPTATLVAKDYSSQERVLDRNDVEKLFSLTVGTVIKLMNDAPILPKDEKVSEVYVAPPSTDMEIKDVSGK